MLKRTKARPLDLAGAEEIGIQALAVSGRGRQSHRQVPRLDRHHRRRAGGGRPYAADAAGGARAHVAGRDAAPGVCHRGRTAARPDQPGNRPARSRNLTAPEARVIAHQHPIRIGIDLGGTKIAAIALDSRGNTRAELPDRVAAAGLRCHHRGAGRHGRADRNRCRRAREHRHRHAGLDLAGDRASCRMPTRPGSTAGRSNRTSKPASAARCGSPTTPTASPCRKRPTAPDRGEVGVRRDHRHRLRRRHCNRRQAGRRSARHRRRMGPQPAARGPSADEHPGPMCWCGRPGCMETWVSGPGCPPIITGSRASFHRDRDRRQCRRRRRGGASDTRPARLPARPRAGARRQSHRPAM